MILKKGYSSEQLRTCIAEYESLGVLQSDELAGKIHIESDQNHAHE